jgi:hypothetical protein
MTSSGESSFGSAWLTAVLRLLAVVIGAVFALFAVMSLAGPPHGDEFFYLDQLDALRVSGWLAALTNGAPVAYLVPLRIFDAAGVPVLAAGRMMSIVSSIATIAVTDRWCRTGLGLSPAARLLVTTTVAGSILITQRAASTVAMADSMFALVVVAAVIAMERAVSGQRLGLAAIAGAGWAVSWLLRPLAMLFSPAIAIALVVLAWRRPAADRAWRTIAIVLATAGIGIAAGQLPSLLTQGRPAVENKLPPNSDVTFAEVRYLSLLRQSERGRPPAPRDELVDTKDVRQYRQDHGAGSLPRTTSQRVWWSFARMPGMTILSAAISTAYMVLRSSGPLALLIVVLIPAWRAGNASDSLFYALVALVFVALLGIVVSAYMETRWFLAASCLAAGVAGLALDRLAAVNRSAAGLAAIVQTVFVACSLAAAVIHTWR